MANQPEKVAETTEDIFEEVTSRFDPVIQYLTEALDRIFGQMFSQEGLLQLSIIVISFVVALLIFRPFMRFIKRSWPRVDVNTAFLPATLRVVRRLALPAVWVIGLWIGLLTNVENSRMSIHACSRLATKRIRSFPISARLNAPTHCPAGDCLQSPRGVPLVCGD